MGSNNLPSARDLHSWNSWQREPLHSKMNKMNRYIRKSLCISISGNVNPFIWKLKTLVSVCNSLVTFIDITTGIFPSTFLRPVNESKNSILNWVKKLNLFHLTPLVNLTWKFPIKLENSKKNYCHCRQTMYKLSFCCQKESCKCIFQWTARLKFQKFYSDTHHGETSRT